MNTLNRYRTQLLALVALAVYLVLALVGRV